MSALLAIRDLRVSYRRGPPWRRIVTPVVDGVSFQVGPGEIVGLIGESGSGKSTIARAVVGLAPVTGGHIAIDGCAGDAARVARARRVQMIFQDPAASLNPRMTIGSQIAEVLAMHRIEPAGGSAALAPERASAESVPDKAFGAIRSNDASQNLSPRAARRARVLELLARVGLPDSAYDRLPHMFSGGQRVRIGIARALAVEPALLIADEATAALDISVQAQILNLLLDLRDDLGLSILFITHDLAVVRVLCDRAVVLRHGRVVEDGPPERLRRAPAHPYTRALFAAHLTVPSVTEPRLADPAMTMGGHP